MARYRDAMTSAVELDVLALIGDLTARDRYVDTESLARAVYDANRAAGRPAVFYPNNGPWFGMSTELRSLEQRGWIDIDPGIAELVPQGAPTPTAKHFYVGLTSSGTEQLNAAHTTAGDLQPND
jgi:hypothetical protein